MPRIRFTYQTITPKSAKQGDFVDHGFYSDGWKYSITGNNSKEVLAEAQAGYYDCDSLASALRNAKDLGIYEYSSQPEVTLHGWWSSVNPDQNYATEEDTWYSLHVEGVTLSTKKRIDRWLNGKRVISVKKIQ